MAVVLHCLDRDIGKSRASELVSNLVNVAISVWRTREKARRVVREHISQRLRDDVRELVVRYLVLHVEEKSSAWLQHTARF
jgi:hypothetical protein